MIVDNWEIWSIRVNNWRLVPRLAVAWYLWFCYKVGMWFMALPDPTTAQTTFATGVWGAAAVWFAFYANSGKVTVLQKGDDNE